jgi:Uma2 family endonuclease
MATAQTRTPRQAGDVPVADARTAADHILLDGVSWETYESLLKDFERSGSNLRMTYDRGSLEIMAPAWGHDRRKKRIAQMVEMMTLELNIPAEPGGSTTLRNSLKERGLEPDECYWIAHEAQVREREEIDLRVDPPPDVAVEIENTSDILDRLPIYAALGFPEIWRADRDGHLTVGLLQPDGSYAWGQVSRAFPFLDMAEFARFLVRVPGEGQTAWLRRFRDWVRAELAPHHARPRGE